MVTGCDRVNAWVKRNLKIIKNWIAESCETLKIIMCTHVLFPCIGKKKFFQKKIKNEMAESCESLKIIMCTQVLFPSLPLGMVLML